MAVPLRILHMTYASDGGGLSKYVFDLCAAMRDLGHKVAIAGDRGVDHSKFLDAGFTWVEVPYKAGPLAMLSATRILKRWLAEHPVDVLHCHYRRPTLVARRLQKRGWPPILFTVHLSHVSLAGARRWLSDFGDHTHVASADALDWVVRDGRVPPEQVSLIPHGVHVERWPVTTPETRAVARGMLGLGIEDRVAAYVGRLDDPKNCDWLIDVAGRWRAEGRTPVLKVLLAGEGPHREALQARIDQEGLGANVRLLGHREPLVVYQAADLLLLPSAREGFSLVCAEGMCTGLPCLRTRTSGTGELIVEGITGASTAIEREAFVSAAIGLLGDAKRLDVMRSPSAARIRERFTFERQLEATLAMYRDLAGTNRLSGPKIS